MTPDELKILIARASTGELVAALAPLTETERKKLSKMVVGLRQERSRFTAAQTRGQPVGSNHPLVTPPGPCPFCGKTLRTARSKHCFECGKDWREEPDVASIITARLASGDGLARLNLALLAVAPWSEAQRIRVWNAASHWVPDAREYLFHVLRDRKPDWLAKWVDKELDRNELADWQFVRRLIRAGLCPKPQTDNYILRMLRGIYSHDPKQSLKERLLDDPELLSDEIWRIFELSPVRETIIDSFDIAQLAKGPATTHNHTRQFLWSGALHELAAEGKLDRQRLLAASLGSLLRNTEARNTTWFHKFHELLEPTEDERQTLQPSYVQLLSHPVPAVVGMALEALSVLEKAQKLDVPGFLDAVGAVFHLQPKAQPLAAVKLLGRIVSRMSEPERQARDGATPRLALGLGLAPRIAEILLAGITHAATPVQEAILGLLPKLGDQATDVIAATLPGQLDSLAPSLQDEARKLVGENSGSVPRHGPALDEMRAEARAAASPWREQAGLDAILQAIDTGGDLTAAPFDSMAIPRLAPDQRVQPIETLDELIERLTIAVEKLDDPIEFELLLDGLSRLCDQLPIDFSARVAPLVHRIQKAMPNLGAIPFGLQWHLFPLVLRWCHQPIQQTRQERDSVFGILELRVGVLATRMQNRQAAPLIACPTHRRGWIDPREMLRRFQWHHENGVEATTHDVIQGLLRLAPDGRAEALAGAGSLQGKFAPAFRYTLGGSLEETQLSPAVLIAAGRARSPFAELAELHPLGADLGPDASHPARYSHEFIRVAQGTQDEQARLHVHVEPARPTFEKMRDLPSVQLHTWRVAEWMNPEGLNRWVGTIWPANLQPFFAVGARLRHQLYMQGMVNRQRADFLEPLFDPDVPFSEVAQLLVALALTQAEPEVTGLAVDVLIELIRDGRCVGPELGRMLASMLQADAIKLNRLGKQLETVSRASLLHAHVCARIVMTACTGLADMPRDFHCLLGPLLEWLTVLEEDVGAEFRLVLAKAKSGKSAALAQRLLKLSFAAHAGRRFLADALEGRLQRVKRWSCSADE